MREMHLWDMTASVRAALDMRCNLLFTGSVQVAGNDSHEHTELKNTNLMLRALCVESVSDKQQLSSTMH